jgi:hypothetical protein
MDYIVNTTPEVNIETKASDVGTQNIALYFREFCQEKGITFVKDMGHGHYVICEKDGYRFLLRMKCHRADWGYLLHNVQEEILAGRKIDFVFDFVFEQESEDKSPRAKTQKNSIEYHYNNLKEHLSDLDDDIWEKWEEEGKEPSEFECYEDMFTPVCVQVCTDFSLSEIFWLMNDVANHPDWTDHLFVEYNSDNYDYYYED